MINEYRKEALNKPIMPNKAIAAISAPLLAVICLTFASGQAFNYESASNDEGRAQDFELTDQYDRSSAYRFPKHKVTVLAFGDRKGASQIEGWVRPLWDRYQTRIDQQGVAVLASVPAFARGVVKRIFKNKVKYSVLLDWSGSVSRAYSYQSGKANLYVIDREGRIVMKVVGAANQTDLNRVYDQVDRLLK